MDLSSIGNVLSDAVSYVQSSLTPTQALDYVRANWNAWKGIGPTIIGLQRKASAVAQQAKAQGRTDVFNDMQARIKTLGDLNVFAGSVQDRLDSLNSALAQLGVPGFGVVAIPVAWVAVIAAVVGAMVYVFFHVNEQSQAIDTQQRVLGMVQAGTLTPQQGLDYAQAAKDTAAQASSTGFTGALTSLKGMLVPIALVAGVVLVVPMLTGGKRRGR